MTTNSARPLELNQPAVGSDVPTKRILWSIEGLRVLFATLRRSHQVIIAVAAMIGVAVHMKRGYKAINYKKVRVKSNSCLELQSVLWFG